MMNQYNLVFEGTICDGYGADEVKRNLAALFKVDKTKVERLFTEQPIVLKQDMDYDAAMKYQRALQKTGAICKVKEVCVNNSPRLAEEAAPIIQTGEPAGTAARPPLPTQSAHSIIESIKDATPELVTKKSSEKKISKGIGDIVAGVVLIGIGLVLGGSVFLGEADVLDYFFDVLGLFWIGKGIYKMVH